MLPPDSHCTVCTDILKLQIRYHNISRRHRNVLVIWKFVRTVPDASRLIIYVYYLDYNHPLIKIRYQYVIPILSVVNVLWKDNELD